MPKVEVSFGELMDKVTILEIKLEMLSTEDQKKTVALELSSLVEQASEILAVASLGEVVEELRKVNLLIWELMDELYGLHEPSSEYAGLTWDITIQNQRRAFLKKEIDVTMGFKFSEEKSFFSKVDQIISKKS
jgi:hypothetical protein